MMGGDGLTEATQDRDSECQLYGAGGWSRTIPVLYKGENGRVAHECIIDLRPLEGVCGIEVEDIAKRLMDYGFHAPTMSFPVPGTLMIEPTESESKAELDRFCEAMIAIRERDSGRGGRAHGPAEQPAEARAAHGSGRSPARWDRPYSREQAAFPAPWVQRAQILAVRRRIDNVYGDRHLVCACLPMEAYTQA